MADLLKLKSVTQATLAGSCRRLKETVADLDVVATAKDSAEPMDALASHPLVVKVLARGETKQRVRLRSGIEMDLRVVPDESYGAAMQYFTGSKEHNIVIRRRAQDRGLKVNEYGVFRGEELVGGRTEEEVYRSVDLPWIPPELRENRGEIERAEKGNLPRLLELDDIRGDLHMHTTATDGTASILEMVEAAKARGREYIAITDHSKRVSMANGLDAARLRAHWKEIDKVRKGIPGIEVLRGVECDILEDARLDLDDEVLAEADWVLAVLHYGLKQPREQITKRLMTAIKNPYVDCIGHPTGRLLTKRPGADVAFDEILKAAADHGVMMEINAHPSRLDLDDVHAAAARDLGIPIVDQHRQPQSKWPRPDAVRRLPGPPRGTGKERRRQYAAVEGVPRYAETLAMKPARPRSALCFCRPNGGKCRRLSPLYGIQSPLDGNNKRLPMRVRPLFALKLALLSAFAACVLPSAGAAEPAKTRTVTAGKITLTVPESWQQQDPTTRMRLTQFAVPKVNGDTENGEFVVYYFGAGSGGGVDANIHRWINQFQPRERKAKLTSGKCPQGEYVLVDLRGTWNKPIGPMIQQKTVETPDARVLGMILTVKDQGNYFLRLTGPQKTVSANADALRSAIGAAAKSEKDYKLPQEN